MSLDFGIFDHLDRNDLPLLRSDDLTDEMLGEVADKLVEFRPRGGNRG